MQYNIHLPYYNETFLYGYGFGIRSFFPGGLRSPADWNHQTTAFWKTEYAIEQQFFS